MSWWKQQLGACLDSVATQLPQLQSSLSQLGHSMGEWVGNLGVGGAAGCPEAGQEYELGGRRLRVVRQLGEGGYSFVYLVKEVQVAGGGAPLAAPADTHLFALKRVLCSSEEQLQEARREAAVMRRLRHPCLLPLLDAAVSQQRAPDGGGRSFALMLFPVFEGGNLFDFVQRQRQDWERAAAAPQADGPPRRAALRAAQLRTALQLFLQVCAALHSMHGMEPALAHRDVKPQNVLLRRRPRQPSGGDADPAAPQRQQERAGGGFPAAAAPAERPVGSGGQRAAGEWAAFGGGTGGAPAAAAPDPQPDAPAVVAVEAEEVHDGQRQQGAQAGPPAEWWERRLEGWRERYEAVLMDFGSTRPARVQVGNRAEAMAVQEDAERHCTAPYRAPELWDVPSSCTLDERVDVWSLGCLLYFAVCGQSPFERAVGEMGGSLMLAVASGRVTWPDDAASTCPASIRQLVVGCLDPVPASRPTVAQVALRADAVLASLPLPPSHT